LDELVRIYVEVGVRERLLFGVYVLEIASLPPSSARKIGAALDADVNAWRTALHRARPELTETEQTVLVHAARAIVHDVVRVGHLFERPRIAEELTALVRVVLGASLTADATTASRA
jgi:hypothetical protein